LTAAQKEDQQLARVGLRWNPETQQIETLPIIVTRSHCDGASQNGTLELPRFRGRVVS
jgi:hypothetical protein